MNKVLIFLIIFILLFSSFAFASDKITYLNSLSSDTILNTVNQYQYTPELGMYKYFCYSSDADILFASPDPFIYNTSTFRLETLVKMTYFSVNKLSNGTYTIKAKGGVGQSFPLTQIDISNYIIYDKNSNVFFSPPITLTQTMEENLIQATQDMVGKMRMILPVGFGVLLVTVLLMVLLRFFRSWSVL